MQEIWTATFEMGYDAGSDADRFGKKDHGTFVYRVYDTDTAVCSKVVTVEF